MFICPPRSKLANEGKQGFNTNQDVNSPTGTLGALTGICYGPSQAVHVNKWRNGTDHMVNTEAVPLRVYVGTH